MDYRMKDIIILTAISILLLTGFIVLLLCGLITGRRKLIFISAGVLPVLGICIAWTVYLFMQKSYNRIAGALRPRSGQEIYVALFDKPASNCTSVINYQDQVLPKIDYAIALQLETCPQELQRILSLHEFEGMRQSSRECAITTQAGGMQWFKPETLGDSILVFQYRRNEYGGGQTIYASLDSTRAFCIDFSE